MSNKPNVALNRPRFPTRGSHPVSHIFSMISSNSLGIEVELSNFAPNVFRTSFAPERRPHVADSRGRLILGRRRRNHDMAQLRCRRACQRQGNRECHGSTTYVPPTSSIACTTHGGGCSENRNLILGEAPDIFDLAEPTRSPASDAFLSASCELNLADYNSISSIICASSSPLGSSSRHQCFINGFRRRHEF
jgi:hypothetical protein